MLLSVTSGCSNRRSTRRARLSPSSSSESRRMRLTRVNAVSHIASTPENAHSTATMTSARTLIAGCQYSCGYGLQSSVARYHATPSGPPASPGHSSSRYLEVRRRSGMSRVSLRVAKARQELLLGGAHLRRLLGFGVVVVEQVQHTVHDEQRQFVVGAHAVHTSLTTCDRRADDDVAEQRRRIAGVGGRPGA